MRYIAYVRKDLDSDFGVDFPDLPGCVSAGTTIEEAHSMAQEAAAAYVGYLIEDGQLVPRASSLDDLKNDRHRRGATINFVEVAEYWPLRRK